MKKKILFELLNEQPHLIIGHDQLKEIKGGSDIIMDDVEQW